VPASIVFTVVLESKSHDHPPLDINTTVRGAKPACRFRLRDATTQSAGVSALDEEYIAIYRGKARP